MAQSILLVEDEAIVAMDLKLQLEDEGFTVVGPAPTVRRALALIEETPPDFAILDVNLNGATSREIAEQLVACGTGFLYLSGYSGSAILDTLPPGRLVQKPVSFPALLRAITEEMSG
ncbi:response regulator [Marinovum sp.]|uniref:response regulator n=1 Tax=Marinovum sp. TaxID=2024839 RepID=UPI002B26AD34|nr:response regulator [Marinovum sp.]